MGERLMWEAGGVGGEGEAERERKGEKESTCGSHYSGSGRSCSLRWVLPGRAGSSRLKRKMQIYKSTGCPDNALLKSSGHPLWSRL